MTATRSSLPSDYCRCIDALCPMRLQCLRYTDRANPRARVFAETLRKDGKCAEFLPALVN